MIDFEKTTMNAISKQFFTIQIFEAVFYTLLSLKQFNYLQ